MNRLFLMIATGGLLLAGCSPATLVPSFEGRAMLVLKPEVGGSGFQAQAPAALVASLGKDDVHRLEIKLYTVAGDAETPVTLGGAPLTRTLSNAELDGDVIFTGLRPETTYRAKCAAFAADEALISLEGADSYTDIVVGTDDRPVVSSLKVRLIPRLFSGEATASGVIVATGSLVPAGTETLE